MPKIMKLKNGQFLVTIPGQLGRAMRLKKGEKVSFILNKKGNLEIVRGDKK